MKNKTCVFSLSIFLVFVLGAVARAGTIYSLSPDVAEFNYLLLPGQSSTRPGRIDPAQLGGTDRILSQVTVYLTGVDLFGILTADIQVKFYDDAGTFDNEIWASSIFEDVPFDGTSNPIPLTFNAIGTTVLPETLYYGVVISDIQGGFPVTLGPQLTENTNPAPTSDAAPAPSIPVSNYWFLSADNTTYTASLSDQTQWVAVEIIAVPEPATWLMAGLALATAAILRKRR